MADNRIPVHTIVHIIASNFYGGPERQIIEHIIRLDKNKFHGFIISFIEDGRKNEILEKAEENKITCHGIPMVHPFDIKALYHLIKYSNKIKADLICTHGYKSTVMGWLVARYLRIPAVAFSRGFTGEDRKVKFYEWIERKFLNWMDGIVSVSAGQMVKLKKFGIKNKNHWIVHNAISVDRFVNGDKKFKNDLLKYLEIPDESVIAVVAGRLSPEKGHTYLLDAIAKLKISLPKIYFLICGSGVCLSALKEQAIKLNIENVCKFLGFRKDMEKIYSLMDFMVLPSLTEGLPNVVLESYVYKKPVIATAVGGVPEIVEHNINGILVESKNSMQLSEAIEKLMTSEYLRKTMGDLGFKKIESEFSFEQQSRSLLDIYNYYCSK